MSNSENSWKLEWIYWIDDNDDAISCDRKWYYIANYVFKINN